MARLGLAPHRRVLEGDLIGDADREVAVLDLPRTVLAQHHDGQANGGTHVSHDERGSVGGPVNIAVLPGDRIFCFEPDPLHAPRLLPALAPGDSLVEGAADHEQVLVPRGHAVVSLHVPGSCFGERLVEAKQCVPGFW